MLSYSLGTLVPDKYYAEDFKSGFKGVSYYSNKSEERNIYGISRFRDSSIIRELEKYIGENNIQKREIDKINDVLEKQAFNVTMLVAVDYWFRANNQPKVFYPELFSDKNHPFLVMKQKSFPNMKEVGRDFLTTFITYADYLRKNVYLEYENIEVEDSDESEADDYDYGFDDGGDDDF